MFSRLRNGAALSSTIMLGACATAVPIHTKEQPAVVVHSSVVASTKVFDNLPKAVAESGYRKKECVYITRDLSTPWSARSYWCGAGVTVPVASIPDSKMIHKAVEQTRHRLAVLREQLNTVIRRAEFVSNQIRQSVKPQSEWVSPALTHAVYAPVPAPSSSTTKVVYHADPKPAHVAVNHHSSRSAVQIHSPVTDKKDDSKRIIFADGREVLGPKGRGMVMDDALLSSVRNAGRVTLRGALIDDEFPLMVDPMDRERRSVGRALSVREFWRSNGIDVSVVDILHYSPDLSGKFVEVVVDD